MECRHSVQAIGEIIIICQWTYYSRWVFPLEKYTIIFTPETAYTDNRLLEVNETERWVRQEVKIYVTPFDKYNNIIDASIYKDVSPYQIKYSNEKEANQVI